MSERDEKNEKKEPRALVANAADKKQVADAKGKETRGRMREIDDLRFVLSSIQGRRLLWRFLEHCSIHATIFTAEDARTNYLAGKQDVGHFIMAEIVEANQEGLFTMMREAQKEKES